MDVRDEDMIEHTVAARLASGSQGLLYIGYLSTREHEVSSRLNGARAQGVDRCSLHHRVRRLDP